MKHLATRLKGIAFGRFAQWHDMPPAMPLQDRLNWTLRRWLRVLGWPGVLAIGILAVFPPFYFSVIAPAQERLDVVRRSTLSLREQLLQTGKSLDGVRPHPDGQLAEFYHLFPEERHAPKWLAKLVALAGKNGLGLNEGEYKTAPDKVGKLMRLQMVLPVKGEYRQIRRFLAALPVEISGIALESIQFSRQNIADSTVEARIRLALYMERAS